MSVYNNLEPKMRKVVNRIVRGEVNFLSGTVAPAKSDPQTMDIESIAHGFEHYAKRGVKQVVVQVKYMGSRGQIYVNKDLDKCFAVSRNGFKINHVDLTDVFKTRHDFWFGNNKNPNLSLVIEDGEIMPWRALGDKLIEDSFEKYTHLYQNELTLLQKLGFDKSKDNTLNIIQGNDVRLKDSTNIEDCESVKDKQMYIELFKTQLNIFAKQEDTYYKPFNILKKVHTDGSEDILVDSNLKNYEEIGEDVYAVVDPSDWKNDEQLHTVLNFVSSNHLEGVMIKPSTFVDSDKFEEKYAPMLKVRNKEYLRIVYGVDYDKPSKLEKLVEKKSIGRKVSASRKEYFIGKNLLTLPVTMLNSKNEDYKEFVAQALISFENGKELDPRL